MHFNSTQNIRKILVVDDNKGAMDILEACFEDAKERDFPNWQIDEKTKALLRSLKLEKRYNKLGSGETLDAILDDVINATRDRIPYSGIISDYQMLTSARVEARSNMPDPENIALNFSKNPNAIEDYDGGIEVAKIANMLGIPVVMYSANPEKAQNTLNSKHLRHLKPAKAIVYPKEDIHDIFKGLAQQILENEKVQGNGLVR